LSFDKSRRWDDTSTNLDNIHVISDCNNNYFESALGSAQADMWTTNNNAWVNSIILPNDVRTWLLSRTDVINLISQAMINGKIWDTAMSGVNKYQIPISNNVVLNSDSYTNTGTYDAPNTNNPNSIHNLLHYA
jgi:hypothetical protein